jgi:two-component system, OmpR family, sensor kinase
MAILRGKSLFRQTFFALIAALIMAQVAVVLVVLVLPRDQWGALTLADTVGFLNQDSCVAAPSNDAALTGLRAAWQNAPPTNSAGLQEYPRSTAQLAAALRLPVADVRLYWHRLPPIRLNREVPVMVNGHVTPLDQTIYLGGAVFARRDGARWCVWIMPPPRGTSDWQWRVVLVVVMCLLSLIPVAWGFARRLSRPIRDFADAADHIGRDVAAPALTEAGPQEMRVAARALNDMQRRIQRQLREREAMIGAIAHDLRTPLSRIAFRVETAPDALREPVQRDVAQMTAMIGAAIDHSRAATANLQHERIDLTALLRAMVEEESAVGHHVVWTGGAAVHVMGDATSLRRLFQNLIGNALAYAGTAEVVCCGVDGHAVVRVMDRGPGIAPERMADMFTPFARGEPSRNRETGGVGLGLAIAQTIAHRHGGEISLIPRDGGGLVAEVILPLV